MSTFRDERLLHQVDAAGLTLHQAHDAVRAARLSRCRHGRARTVHRARRRPHVSQYRSALVLAATTESPETQPDSLRRRRALPVVLLFAVALLLLYTGFIRTLDPVMNTRDFLIGVYLIAVAAAVTLNASTLGAMTPTAGDSERAVRLQRQKR